jgi:hypothetical protein
MMKNMNEIVLLYNLDNTDKGRKVKFTLIRLGIRIKNISKEQYNQAVGALAGMKEHTLVDEDYTGEGFEEEMIVMKGLSSSRIDQMLLQFRKNDISKINLKAIITPSNQTWNSIQLYEEIKKEHEEMSGKTKSKI